ncbi:hypothetical protein IMCC3317_33000 [Kordia antarctica]|uniref:GLPGLI family protein n=1 Tax=Kordia antarctica TaxID=1218801 RepID=A0A7L4ZN63_9FLAO|nr:GLPGLI family protein [Kordia antarctica]QHI37917.1 hypothetical protein IMCC3317_33000 [Kordia antarctica]
MKRYFLLFLLIPLFNYVQAQSSQTGIIYFDHIDNHYSESYNAYLVFNQSKSYFVTAKDSLGLSKGVKVAKYNGEEEFVEVADFDEISKTRKNGLEVFLDKLQDTMYFTNAFTLASKTIYGKEKRPNLTWKFTTDTKMIGKFNCKKATTLFRGRKYICWYTEEIPLSYGPWKLQGLPGIILEAKSDDNFFIIKFKKIKYPEEKVTVPTNQNKLLPKKEKFISMKEYMLKQKNEIKRVDNHLKITAKRYGVRVNPYNERDNFLEIFNQ